MSSTSDSAEPPASNSKLRAHDLSAAIAMLDQWAHPGWLLDSQLVVVHVNKPLLDFLGVESTSEWARQWQIYVHPDDLAAVEAAWAHASQLNQPHLDQRRMRTASGQYRWMAAHTLPAALDEHGRATHWLGIVADIHEERTGAERLARLQRLTADLASAVTPLDVAERILNHGLAALEAQRALVMLVDDDRTHLTMLHDVNYPPALSAAKWQADLTESHAVTEAFRTGAKLFLSSRKEVLSRFEKSRSFLELLPLQEAILVLPLIAKGAPIGVLLFAYDAKFSAASSYLEFGDALAELCAQALDRAMLFDKASAALSQAESANKAKTAFIANMSHEFRTPLSAILGFAEFLSSDQLASAKRSYFAEGIRRNGQALLKLVEDILDLSRVESGKITVEAQTFSPRALVRDALELFKDEAFKKGLKISIKGASLLPTTFCSDPVRLRQIFLNLIGNAVKFTQAGSITIECLPSAGETPSLRFAFRDTGIGLSAEQASRLFQPFGQADRHTRRKYGGTGLGLFISRRLAEALGGQLELETSETDQGSCFLLQISELAPASPPALAGSALVNSADLGGRRILIVEDTRDLRNLLSAHLERAGAEVDVARDGQEGLIRASDGEHDIVLMDLSMPVMDGYTATRRLREDGYSKPIIAITAHAQPEDRTRCFEVGFDAYLTKPLNLRELETTIRRLLARVNPPTPRAT